ncbi:hypothetical protein U9M48_014081 [Paspalum notatum var. saurae]|uniref:Reverse transcriptase Ty1/copia-type domain-containing protein n=1 Tax=Paspalum notatum var. saurae TaxID=547442 RepID=A0AAQ3WKC7_PASNO
MENEMRSMSTNKVWDLEKIPKGAKTVGCKWVYKTKHDSKGNVARLVAKGFTQREGIDYTKTFSPVSSKNSFKIIMALVAHYDLELHQMDVKTAFLNGDLYENVFMAQPKGFDAKGKENLRSFDYKENIEKNCIYAKFKNGKFIFLVLYVNDILLTSSDMNLLLETKNFLSSNFGMKDLGEAWYVFGIEIHRDRKKGVLGLSQKAHIENILKRYSMHKCKALPVPIVQSNVFGNFECPKNKNKYKMDRMKSVPYASVVGSIIIYNRDARQISEKSKSGIKKTLRYLQGTKNLMLTYRKSNALEIVGYSDADMAGCRDTRKSILCYIFTLARGAISWKSSKQSIVVSSTEYAEIIACYEATGQALWLKKFVPGLKVVDSIEKPLKLYCDNEPAISYSYNKSNNAAKYIDIKYYIVKEKIQDQTIMLEHIESERMLADPLTKGLPPKKFIEHVAGMGLKEDL